jgi:hypothetical protein
MQEWRFLLFVMMFFAFLGLLMAMLPSNLRFFSPFDFAWFGGALLGVAGTCVIATGIPCAVALTVFGFVSFLMYVVVSFSIFKIVIFVPLIIVLIYIVARLGRGGG